jgi:sugar phosphate permease
VSPPSTSRSSPRTAWTIVALLWITYCLNYVDRQAVFSIYPALRRDLAFSNTQFGLIGSTFTWTYSVCMMGTGRIADLLRVDRIILCSLVLWSLATLGTALSGSVAVFLFWRVLMGITESLYVPAALSLIVALHGSETRSRALGIHMTAQLAGIVAGGWWGGWAADRIGWRNGFAWMAVAGITYAAVLWVPFRRLPDHRSRTAADIRNSPARLFRSSCFNALLAAFFAYCTMLWMMYAWLPDFIYERYGLSMTQSGLTATLYLQISTAAGVLLGTAAVDRMAARFPAARLYFVGVGLLCSAPFAALALSASSLIILKLSVAGFGLFGGCMMGTIFPAAYDVVDHRNYGFAVGILNLFGGLAGGTAIFFAGLWKGSLGIGSLMTAAAALSVAAAAVLLGVSRLRFRVAATTVTDFAT